MMNDVYEKFLKSSEEFIFAENKPEKSDIIFVPGNGYPQMAEKAAELFKKGMAFSFATGRPLTGCILPLPWR